MARLNAAVVASLMCVTLAACLAGQSAADDTYYYPDNKFQDKVRKEVEKAIRQNPGIGAALVRLVFHDCWINGCDGSVLLDWTPADGANTEKKAANNIGLDGFDLIDTIKGKVGYGVSCADILVFAGREAVDILSGGKIRYDVSPGLKDGVASSASAADADLPHSTFEFSQLQGNFQSRNFTVEELVVLSGAHSIGVAHRSSFKDRLGNGADATPIDPQYQAALSKATLQGNNPTVPNNARDASDAFQRDAGYNTTELGVDPRRGVLDNSYYHNNLVNKVLFKSDWVLRTDGFAGGKLQEYKDNAAEWNSDFADAMAKLSKLRPPQGNKLEVRKRCRYTNSQPY